MSEQIKEIESQGQDVQAAINAGLSRLGVGREEVTIVVLDEGAKGLLGIGSRDAVVRLSIKQEEPAQPAAVLELTTDSSLETDESADEASDEKDIRDTALAVVRELLEKMQISAELTATLSEPDDLTGRQIHILEVSGNDLGVLIGPRGETLNALQHIARLMVGHRIRERASFVIDVQGYRKRREKALARLAERMAKKVWGQKRAITLEPMPPHERRIIHVALRDNDDVYTRSTGEGRRRRVRIWPKDD